MKDHNVLIVIPAKGMSTRLPGKNTRPFRGRPLLDWTIDHALDSDMSTDICITSDCPEILDVFCYGRSHVYGVLRSDSLSGDIPTDPVIRHAVQTMEKSYNKVYDIVVTLQCTSPVRPDWLIDDCIRQLISDPGASSIVTVHCPGHFIWMLNPDNYDYGWSQVNLNNRPLSQELHPNEMGYVENGSVVVTIRDELMSQRTRVARPVVCRPIDPVYGVDIDTEIHFKIAEFISEYLEGLR